MPIRTLLALYQEGQKIEIRQYSELADLHLISNSMKIDYYMGIKQKYLRMLNPEMIEKHPEKPGGPVLQAGSDEALLSMKNVGRGMKRFLGYGRR